MLATRASDHMICLWNPETGEQFGKLEGHTDEVFRVIWYPDGQSLASGSADNSIRLWNTKTRQLRPDLSAIMTE
jgi:WD40 repeat protein